MYQPIVSTHLGGISTTSLIWDYHTNPNLIPMGSEEPNPTTETPHLHLLHSLPLTPFPNRWWTRETTAVVTGGNRGIGFEIAKKLAEEGLGVVLTARDVERGIEAIELLAKQGLNNVHFAVLDVSDPSSISSFVASFEANFGVLDILVNNAGVSFNDVNNNSVDHAQTVVTTNFFGAKLLTETLLPLFRCSSSKSRILNVSSRLGSLHTLRNPNLRAMLEDEESLTEERIERFVYLFLESVKSGRWKSQGWPEIWPDYAVSKLALNAYSRMLARRLKGFNICVNCFCPGFTKTGMTGGKGSRTADVAGHAGAMLALLPPQQIKTGKFSAGQHLLLHSKF